MNCMSEVEQRRMDISRFLELCVLYSDDSLVRKRDRLADSSTEGREDLLIEVEKWEAFREFVKYTITELHTGLLDEWLERLHDQEFHPSPGK